MKKSSKHENDWFLMYIVFYMIVRNYRFWGSILEFIASVISKILPDWMQTRKFKDTKYRHVVVNKENDWGLEYDVFAIRNMTEILAGLGAPIAIWSGVQLESISGINRNILYILFLLGVAYLAKHISSALFVESKYRKRISEFDKRSRLWKFLWGVYSLLFILMSTVGSFKLIQLILT